MWQTATILGNTNTEQFHPWGTSTEKHQSRISLWGNLLNGGKVQLILTGTAVWRTWTTIGILILLVAMHHSWLMSHSQLCCLEAGSEGWLWRSLLAFRNPSNLFSLLPHHPVWRLLLESIWNNLISHYPVCTWYVVLAHETSSAVTLADSWCPSTQFKLHLLCDTVPEGLYAEVGDPLGCPLNIYTLLQSLLLMHVSWRLAVFPWFGQPQCLANWTCLTNTNLQTLWMSP